MSSQECANKFCKTYVKSTRAHTNNVINKYIKEYPKKLRDIENKLKNPDKLTQTQLNDLQSRKKGISIVVKAFKQAKTQKYKKKVDKASMDHCKRTYCNPNCKSTFYEAGNKLSKSFIKRTKVKRMKSIEKWWNTRRKEFFGNKTNILKDNFYEKIPKRDVNEMKQLGAISGCTPFWSDAERGKIISNKTRRKRNH